MFNLPIYDSLDVFDTQDEIYVISAIGDPKNREKMYAVAEEKGFEPAIIIHPSALVSEEAKVSGKGVIICQNCVVQPFAEISEYTYLHTG